MTPRMKLGTGGIALILATNAIAIGGALYNRSGAPESRLVLSERELTVPYAWGAGEENSGLSLYLNWRMARETPDDDMDIYPYRRDADWLDAEKLAAVGFDTVLPTDGTEAARHYSRQLDRDALLVLELDGPAQVAALQVAHQRAARAEAEAASLTGSKTVQEKLESAREGLLREQDRNSRLFVVDVGPELLPLREKYPDTTRYAIVRGHVGISECARGQRRYPCGHVAGLEVADVNVPLALRPVFEGAQPTRRAREPDRLHYTSVVAFGRRLEPWLVSAERGK